MPINPYEPPKEESEAATPRIARGCFAPLNFRDLLWLLAVCAICATFLLVGGSVDLRELLPLVEGIRGFLTALC